MALFSRKKTTKESAPKAGQRVESGATATDVSLASVLEKPRITEKAVGLGEKNVYTFVVRRDATKKDVLAAVKSLYNVTPVRVNIVNKSPRQFMSRSKGRRLTEKGMKKAYVYLKHGDSISLM